MTIICVDNTPIMLQSLKENAVLAFPRANVQAFPGAEAALTDAMCCFAKSILPGWTDCFWLRK